jgi:4-amino-4-deoxy-L-arabinose transferase-like glycosyltransferase
LYEWGLAIIYKFIGTHNSIARIYSLLLFSLGLLAFYKILIFQQIKPFIAFIGSLFLLFNPILFYDSANAMPDIMALNMALWALYFFIKHSQKRQISTLLMATLFAVIAGLIKFQFLIIPFASIVYFKWERKNLIYLSIATITTTSLVISWYQYALKLTEKNNLREYGLWIKPITIHEKFSTFVINLTIDTPELIMGWPLLITFIYYLSKSWRSFKFSSNIAFVVIGMISFLLFYLVAIERFKHHSYYFISLIPFLIFATIHLIKNQKHALKLASIILLLQMVWSIARIIPSRWTENKWQLPQEFVNTETLYRLQKSIPKQSKVVIGSDLSGCVYFYFTQTKGYSFEHIEELTAFKNGIPYFEIMRRDNVKYLIVNEENTDIKKVNLLPGIKLYNKIGNFYVWELESVQ